MLWIKVGRSWVKSEWSALGVCCELWHLVIWVVSIASDEGDGLPILTMCIFEKLYIRNRLWRFVSIKLFHAILHCSSPLILPRNGRIAIRPPQSARPAVPHRTSCPATIPNRQCPPLHPPSSTHHQHRSSTFPQDATIQRPHKPTPAALIQIPAAPRLLLACLTPSRDRHTPWPRLSLDRLD